MRGTPLALLLSLWALATLTPGSLPTAVAGDGRADVRRAVSAVELSGFSVASNAESGQKTLRVKPANTLNRPAALPLRERLRRLQPGKAAPASPNADPAVTKLQFQVVPNTVSQYGFGGVTAEIRVFGTLQNLGLGEFKHGGTVVLYKWTKEEMRQPFGSLPRGKTILFEHRTDVRYDDTWMPDDQADFVFKIEFDGGINDDPKNYDANPGNNEISLKHAPVYEQLMIAYTTITAQQGQQGKAPLLNQINQYRASKGLNALVFDACLNTSAQGHSEWMWRNSSMSHTGNNGSNFVKRCEDAGCFCGNGAENITTCGAGNAFSCWKGSPPHNDAMLFNFRTKIGIGVMGAYVTAVFR